MPLVRFCRQCVLLLTNSVCLFLTTFGYYQGLSFTLYISLGMPEAPTNGLSPSPKMVAEPPAMMVKEGVNSEVKSDFIRVLITSTLNTFHPLSQWRTQDFLMEGGGG